MTRFPGMGVVISALSLLRRTRLPRRSLCLSVSTISLRAMPMSTCLMRSASFRMARCSLQRQGWNKKSAEHAIKPKQKRHARLRLRKVGCIGLAQKPAYSRNDTPISSFYQLPTQKHTHTPHLAHVQLFSAELSDGAILDGTQRSEPSFFPANLESYSLVISTCKLLPCHVNL
jgi:hypothetical protein